MIKNDGFTDLRMSQAHGLANEDSVWPSFTDIMTVIVMIFLMALVIILIRNVDLVQQLRETMRSEEQVAELARTKEQQRSRLERELGQTRGLLDTTKIDLSTTRKERDLARGEGARLSEKVAAMLGEIAALEKLRNRLTEQNTAAGEENTRLTADIGSLQQQYSNLNLDLSGLKADYQDLEAEKSKLGIDLETLQSNYALLEKLRGQLAAELAQSMTSIAGLETDKISALDQNARLTGELEQLNRTLSQLELGNQQLERDNTLFSDQVASLKEQMEALVQRFVSVQKERSRAQSEKLAINEELESVRSDYALSLDQLAMLKDDLLKRELELDSGRRSLEDAEKKVLLLKGDYVDLEDKYNKLVRPARSTVGRFLVDIRFTQKSGINLYQIRESGEQEYRSVNLQQLHTRLGELKTRDPNNLYTRIVIPDDSGLSYNEAWKFTNDILTKYDYYHQ